MSKESKESKEIIYLDYSFKKLKEFSFKEIKEFINLKTINLEYNMISSLRLIDTIDNETFLNLNSIFLGYNRLDEKSFKEFLCQNSDSLKNLKTLSLDKNKFKTWT